MKTERDLLKSVNHSTLPWRVSTCSGSDHRMSLTTTLATPIMLENRGSDNKRMKEAQQGLENPNDKFHGWLGPFMHAHSKLTESGDVSFYSQSTSEVAQRALRESNKDSNGERKNDALTKALQTKEQ
jgi:hypothetical protein